MSKNLQIFMFWWFLTTLPVILRGLHRIMMAVFMYKTEGLWISTGWKVTYPPKLLVNIFKYGLQANTKPQRKQAKDNVGGQNE